MALVKRRRRPGLQLRPKKPVLEGQAAHRHLRRVPRAASLMKRRKPGSIMAVPITPVHACRPSSMPRIMPPRPRMAPSAGHCWCTRARAWPWRAKIKWIGGASGRLAGRRVGCSTSDHEVASTASRSTPPFTTRASFERRLLGSGTPAHHHGLAPADTVRRQIDPATLAGVWAIDSAFRRRPWSGAGKVDGFSILPVVAFDPR